MVSTPLWRPVRNISQTPCSLQSQKAAAAHLKSKQLLPFGFVFFPAIIMLMVLNHLANGVQRCRSDPCFCPDVGRSRHIYLVIPSPGICPASIISPLDNDFIVQATGELGQYRVVVEVWAMTLDGVSGTAIWQSKQLLCLFTGRFFKFACGCWLYEGGAR